MQSSVPNFSPYPFEALRRVSRREARLESAIARWLDVASDAGARLATLVRLGDGSLRARVIEPVAPDPLAAWCEIRPGAIRVAGGNMLVRRLAQRVLGGPPELDAPRPLTLQEQAVWALVVSTALDDLGVHAEVVLSSPAPAAHALALELAGETAIALVAIPATLELRVPPPRAPRVRLAFEVPVVVARCALPRGALVALAARDVIAVERCGPELVLFGGAIGLATRGVETIVRTEYVPRAMALPDDAHVELTVTVGTVRLTLRELSELVVGAIVPLGRPLAGPFELRAAGSVIGSGELVNLEGELGVRVIRIDGAANPP